MSNKVTLNALSRKHAQLQAEILAIEKELIGVQENLSAVEKTIKLIDSDYDTQSIKPAVNYSKWDFERGEVPSLVGDFVRNSVGNFSCPEIVSTIVELKNIDLNTKQMEKLNLRVYNALKRLEQNKIIVYVGKIKSAGSAVLWRKTI